MPNIILPPSIDKNSLKGSNGVSSNISAKDLQTNYFLPTQVIDADQGKIIKSSTVIDNFNINSNSIIGTESSLLQNTIQQNFASSIKIGNSTSVLNRDITSSLSSNNILNTNNVEFDTLNSFSTNFSTNGSLDPLLDTFSYNVLDDYDNVTYNFKLMLAPESALTQNTTVPNSDLYVIAQSGVTTTFNIKDVEIESIVAPNDRTKNTFSTIFRIKIVETQGISLIDRIFEAASVMNIKNIMNAPMLLELSFKGFTQDGTPTEVNVAKRTWKLQLIDMPAKLEIGGSEYDMNFISLNDYGFHRFSSASIIKQQLTFGVDKIGDFFDSFGYYLTLQDAVIASKGIQSRNEYEFVVQPDMRTWVIGQPSAEPNAPSMFIDANDKRNIVLKPGHKIEDIIDNVLSTTKEASKLANPKSDSQKMDKPQQGDSVSKIFNISCETRIIGFNENNNEYIRKFIYYVNSYDAFRALPEKPDSNGQNERISYMLTDALRKKYSYIFTGNNTDVLNLNLELNNLWRHATTYYTQAMHRAENNSSDFLVKSSRDLGNIDDLRLTLDTAFESNPNNTYNSNNVFSTNTKQNLDPSFEISNQTVSTPVVNNDRLELQQRLLDLQKLKNPNTIALKETLAGLDTVDNVVPLEGQNTSKQIPGINSIPQDNVIITGNNVRFLSPSTVSNNLIETLPGNSANPLLNMFIKQVDPALDIDRVNENIESTTDLSRSIFGIIANQMYTGIYSDLLQIDLEIRGDPFWLGETDIEMVNRLKSGKSRQPSDGNFANYLRGENSFFLTFKTPKNYNENTGFVDIEESTTFMGVYNVIHITHSFSEGKFIQKLNAIRDINTDPQQIKRITR